MQIDDSEYHELIYLRDVEHPALEERYEMLKTKSQKLEIRLKQANGEPLKSHEIAFISMRPM